MGAYSGIRRSIAPSLTTDNWTLVTGAGESGKVYDIGFSGEMSVSTPMQTRVARSSGQAGAETLGSVAKLHVNSVANLISFVTSFLTTQAALDAGDLIPLGSWNANGGVIRWAALPGEELIILSSANISCRNSVGTGTSSYGVVWSED